MPERFEPNRRLLRILVGSNLYGSQDASIRELVQNAFDAIQLRKTYGDERGGRIQIRYSASDRWFEIVDDGIGMNKTTIKESFLQIGQDKIDVLNKGSRQNQIGYFGIGILSVFLLSDKFEVSTKYYQPSSQPLRFKIMGIDDNIVWLDPDRNTVGTSIKVYPLHDTPFDIASIPTSVRQYARHVDGIEIISVDDDTRENLSHNWITDSLDNVKSFENTGGIIAGRFGLSPALEKQTGTLSSEITICNSGFLVEEKVPDLLPVPQVGLIGEIDLHPNTLTMGMSRERIQRDDKWKTLGSLLEQQFIHYALEELQTGHLQHTGKYDDEEIKRTLLIWYHNIPPTETYSHLNAIVERRVFETVPFKLADRGPSSLKQLVTTNTRTRNLYYRQIGKPNELTSTFDDDGLPIRISQEIRDSIRVSALRANGFAVLELGTLQVNVRHRNSVYARRVDEHELVRKCLQVHGISLTPITEAPESDMDLRNIEKLPILNDALSVGGGLRFASVPDSTRRVITDSLGTKYINLRNMEVQQLITAIPRATSNPLRKRLLEAYLKIEDFKLHDARSILSELLLTDDLALMATADTAPFTQKHVEGLIRELLEDLAL